MLQANDIEPDILKTNSTLEELRSVKTRCTRFSLACAIENLLFKEKKILVDSNQIIAVLANVNLALNQDLDSYVPSPESYNGQTLCLQDIRNSNEKYTAKPKSFWKVKPKKGTSLSIF